MRFASKARSLSALRGRLGTARIAPLCYFTAGEWRNGREDVQRRLEASLPSGPWIVRSSCGREDGYLQSNAGAFLSVRNVQAGEVAAAVDSVLASYGDPRDGDEVLVQPMLSDVVRAGVAFSHDPHTCSPYRVVNWAMGSDTAAVTGGLGGMTWQQAALSKLRPPGEVAAVLPLLEELLGIFDGDPIDIEFAFSQDGEGETLWLLQVRPLILARPPESACEQAARLELLARKVAAGMRPHPLLAGRGTLYGVMPDWNPAEMIGVRPKPLSLSLYRELITDGTWAEQRHDYGYKDVRCFPLMMNFCGMPYVDVRLSFNSFIPETLSSALSDKLVDHYIEALAANPAFHDKIEFEIVYSCYALDLPDRLRRLERAGFSPGECAVLADGLRTLTNRILRADAPLWRKDLERIDHLMPRRRQILASDMSQSERIWWLLADAKRYGTLPFAGLARAGFIAVEMLRSLVAVGVLSRAESDAFMNGMSTISRELTRDLASADKRQFLDRYGHLRPGTYDLLSPRYDEAPDAYFDWNRPTKLSRPGARFELRPSQIRDIDSLLAQHGLETNATALLEFVRAGIEFRELAKFEFTRNVSDMLAIITDFGRQLGFSPDELAYADIAAFKEISVLSAAPSEIIAHSIEQGRARHAATLSTALPPLITTPDEVWGFRWPDACPNFVTQKQVTAPVISTIDRHKLAGALVCIPSADPGFDWLFTYPIAGLITAWGGANSHMAIRAAELQLPAIIGAGEHLYRRWSAARRLSVDCAGKRVAIMQ